MGENDNEAGGVHAVSMIKPTRREALTLVGMSAMALAGVLPDGSATEIVVVDGWVLSPADLAPDRQ